MSRPTYTLKSVDNALSLLSMLLSGRVLQVSAAAEELEVAPSTAHRLLAMLAYHGFAEQGADKSYRTAVRTSGVWQPSVLRDAQLQAIARPELLALSDQLHETVHLMVQTGRSVEFIESIETQSQTLRVGVRVGTLLPAHQTSGGKAMLAQLRPHELTSLYPDGPPTETYADLDTFERYLNAVRLRGYASNFEETERGVNAIGSCIRFRFGSARAAVAVSAPAHRLLRSQIPEVGTIVQTSARRVEDNLRMEHAPE